jgi:hypothetical protein
MMSYDSRPETLQHIHQVRIRLVEAVDNLVHRADVHDRSKLVEPELATYDIYTPKLRELVYGSPEYKQALADMGPALAHHYAENSHHPEHTERGIRGMSLLDLIEMTADWKAAGERHADGGDIMRSIALNQSRFGYSDELREILENTVRELGW